MKTGDRLSKWIVGLFFALVMLLVFLWGNGKVVSERALVWPMFNASAKETWMWPKLWETPTREINENGLKVLTVVYYPNISRNPERGTDGWLHASEKGSIAFQKQINGMNEFLATHPTYFSDENIDILKLTERYDGNPFCFSNADFLGDDGMVISKKLDCAQMSFDDIRMNGSKFLLEMRSFYYETQTGNRGRFLEAVGDPSVLENLERIGPKSNFSDEELAWFAENLSDCEVVDIEAERVG